jgi:Ca-activated chloride channel family protein
MRALNKFLEYRTGDAFGLTFFGNSVLHWVPLTNDVSAFRCAAPFMRPENAPPWFGGTEIGKALLACREVLAAREEGDRMIILISDGFSSDLSNSDEDIARRLRAENIVVYAVNIQESEAPGEIVNIARLTGGEVFNVVDPPTLEHVFQRIDEMQETRLEKGAAEYVDFFWPFCLVGLVLQGVWSLLRVWLRYTPW